ncbi:MAG TPA: hypothetical protein VF701_20635 [Thermoanaerobaculia bacterium]
MDNKPVPEPRRESHLRLIAAGAAVLVAVFLLAWLPNERKLRRVETTLQIAELDLRLATAHRKLGVASHHAARGDYPETGIAAMQFFRDCAALAESGALDDRPRTKGAIGAYASNRDAFLGQIAANDPTVHERLASLYLVMNGVIQRRE